MPRLRPLLFRCDEVDYVTLATQANTEEAEALPPFMSLWRVCNILLQHLENEYGGEEKECEQGNASGEGGDLEAVSHHHHQPPSPAAETVWPPPEMAVDDVDDMKIKGQERKAFRRSLSAHGLSRIVVGFDSAMFTEIYLGCHFFCFCADLLHLGVIRFMVRRVRRSVLHVLLVSIQAPVPARI